MGDESRILRFEYKGYFVDVSVDMDKSNLLDVIIDYEDKAKDVGLEICRNPEFHYVWKLKNYPLQKDNLQTMFDRLSGTDCINIWVGELAKPSELYNLVLDLRKTQSNATVVNVVPILSVVGERSYQCGRIQWKRKM